MVAALALAGMALWYAAALRRRLDGRLILVSVGALGLFAGFAASPYYGEALSAIRRPALTNAKLAGADLTGYRLVGADLIFADLGCHGPDAATRIATALEAQAPNRSAGGEPSANDPTEEPESVQDPDAGPRDACVTLAGAELRGAELRGAVLIGAKLSGADITAADLHPDSSPDELTRILGQACWRPWTGRPPLLPFEAIVRSCAAQPPAAVPPLVRATSEPSP